MRCDHVASVIIHADHGSMCAAEKLGVLDCVIWCGVPQPTEWQHVADQINAAMIRARADYQRDRKRESQHHVNGCSYSGILPPPQKHFRELCPRR